MNWQVSIILMDSFLLDTNIIVDAFSAGILECLNYKSFFVSYVVLKEEIIKQVPVGYYTYLNTLNEKADELLAAQKYSDLNKSISFYDALNCVLAKEREMTLVTGDQQLIKFANKNGVNCIGTIRLIELLIDKELLNADKSIDALEKLKQDPKRRIPHKLIDLAIEKIKISYVLVK